MQIVPLQDNLHEISKSVFWIKENENYFKMSSAEFLPSMLSIR